MTPLFFSDAESDLLRGSNMYGAVAEQRALWQAESETVQELLDDPRLTW